MNLKFLLLITLNIFIASYAFADFSEKEFMKILKDGEYALISAGKNFSDPADAKLIEEQISARTQKLKTELKTAKFNFHKVTGRYNALEESFFVSMNKKQEAVFLNLGEKFNQESIIVGNHGHQKMIYTTGKDKGFVHSGAGFIIANENQKDFFTELVTTDNKKIKFSLNFDFDHKCKNRIAVYVVCHRYEQKK